MKQVPKAKRLGAYRPRSNAKVQPRIPVRFENPEQLALIRKAKARLNPEPTTSLFILQAAVERANTVLNSVPGAASALHATI
jgi:uncharacterized protein (DUF1778 family)